MKSNKAITVAFGICFAVALFAAASGQQIGGGGSGGGGTPGGSNTQVQFNNSGAFGGSSNFIWDGTYLTLAPAAGGIAFNTTGIGTGATNKFLKATGANSFFMAASNVLGDGILVGARLFFGGGQPVYANSQSSFGWNATNNSDDTTIDAGISRNAAGVMEINNGINVPQNGGALREIKLRSVVVGGTVPGISGCSAGTQTGGGTAGTYSSGTTGTCTVTLTFAFTAPTGWVCTTNNQTTAADPQRQSASTTTTATITGTTVSGDVISFHCTAY